MNYDVVLIDGDNVAFKNHFANIHLSFEGKPSGAIFGFLQSILTIRKNFGNNLIITWSDNNSYRKKIYPDYKIHRKKEDLKDFFIQLDKIKEVLSSLNIIQVKLKDREADDAIANITYDLKDETKSILIVSEDKDLLQLIDHNVYQYKNKEVYNIKRFIEKYEFSPRFIPLFLSIVGDKSDNIIGVPNIGKVKATKLIKEYGDDLLPIINKGEELKPLNINLNKIIQYKDTIIRNIKLTDLSLVPKLKPEDNLMKIGINRNLVMEILSEYGLASLITDIFKIIE